MNKSVKQRLKLRGEIIVKKEGVDLKDIKPSKGYILIDPKKCSGCQTCMMACSLVHMGKVNTDLAYIQVTQNPFEGYPNDIRISQCRQCINPECLFVCPTGAIYVDRNNGNVRRIDGSKCTGCQICILACPYRPSRIIWDFDTHVASKCDLCVDTPFWSGNVGRHRRQACVEICPTGAIEFSEDIPSQIGEDGYEVNLRGDSWPLDKG